MKINNPIKLGKRFKWTLKQMRYMDSKQTHKKIFN